ncbi:hypothetical protein M758_8G131700 [Ceratodon purpureus]|nr:hypothetical protein M758_8G131700 [Ceratodon purpureus]
MLISRERILGFLRNFVSSLTLSQTLLLCFWVFSLLLQKLVDGISEWLCSWLTGVLDEDTPTSSELAGDLDRDAPIISDQPGTLIDDARSSFEISAVGSSEEYSSIEHRGKLEQAGDEVSFGGLISVMPDHIVQEVVWPVMARSPELLFRLRCVNRRWRYTVDSSIEWRALELVLIDTPGLLIATPEGLDSAPTVQSLATALYHLRFVLSEDMKEIETRVRYSSNGFRALPCYVSMEGCPSDVEECPSFYNL